MAHCNVQRHNVPSVFFAVFIPADSRARRRLDIIVGQRVHKTFNRNPRQTRHIIIVVIRGVVVFRRKRRLFLFLIDNAAGGVVKLLIIVRHLKAGIDKLSAVGHNGESRIDYVVKADFVFDFAHTHFRHGIQRRRQKKQHVCKETRAAFLRRFHYFRDVDFDVHSVTRI